MSMELLTELLYGSRNNITERTEYLQTLVKNQTNKTFNFNAYSMEAQSSAETAMLILAYIILAIISIFGNSLVCHVIFKNKRLHTATNFFLANLAISDLLVAGVNIPFNIARNVLDEWPFGEVLCHLVNCSLIVSVYVSTYTLTVIALDRHRVVVEPFTSRMSKKLSIFILLAIWFFAICLALPYGIYNTVEDVTFFIITVKRCHSKYPTDTFEQYLTVVTMVLQYFGPLAIIGIAYGKIVHKLWMRTHVGAVTEYQQKSQSKAKIKSIKLLITVVIVFAICWLPLNLYHVLTDLHPNVQQFRYSSRVFFACHWVAVSSVCYNPFLYFWLNDSFRKEVVTRFHWCLRRFFTLNLISPMRTLMVKCNNCRKSERKGKLRSTTRSSGASFDTSLKIIKRDASNITEREEILHILANENIDRNSGVINPDEVRNLPPGSNLLPMSVLVDHEEVL